MISRVLRSRAGFPLVISLLLVFTVAGVEFLLGSLYLISKREASAEFSEFRLLRLRESRGITRVIQSGVRTQGRSEDRTMVMETDRHGFLLPSIVHEQPDRTVVFLGGSSTACLEVEPTDRFPYRVGRELENTLSLKINSINSGFSGSHSMNSMVSLLTRILPLKPDLVVLMHNLNDLGNAAAAGDYWHDNRPYSVGVRYDALQSLGLNQPAMSRVRFAGWRQAADLVAPNLHRRLTPNLRRFAVRSPPPVSRFNSARAESWFESSLRAFVHTCRAWGIQPVLMTQANRISATSQQTERVQEFTTWFPEYVSAYDRFNEIIRRTAAEEGVLLVDLARHIPGEPEFLLDKVHLSKAGSLKAASIIADRLRPTLKTGPNH